MPNVHLVEFEGPTLAVIQPPTLRCIGRCSNMNVFQAPAHTHPVTELVFVVSGEGVVSSAGALYSLFPGAIALYNPQVVHSEQFPVSNCEVLFYHVKLDDYAVSGLPVNRLLAPGAPLVLDSGAERMPLQMLLELMFSEAQRRVLGYRQTLDDLVSALFTLILRVLSANHAKIPVMDSNSIVFKVQQHIMTRYACALSVKSMAEQFHVDPCYLSHAFKKSLGLSPYQYLTEFRISAAGRLLKTGTASVRAIAEAVGFPNVNNFEVQFKKFKGMTPCEYRKQASNMPLFVGSSQSYPLDE